jgi:hypothetical protein
VLKRAEQPGIILDHPKSTWEPFNILWHILFSNKWDLIAWFSWNFCSPWSIIISFSTFDFYSTKWACSFFNLTCIGDNYSLKWYNTNRIWNQLRRNTLEGTMTHMK